MNIKNNCRKFSGLIEKKQWSRLAILERMTLTIHVAGCPECKIYKRQSENIHSMITEFFKQKAVFKKGMDEQCKNQIQTAIEQALKK